MTLFLPKAPMAALLAHLPAMMTGQDAFHSHGFVMALMMVVLTCQTFWPLSAITVQLTTSSSASYMVEAFV